ncbi:type II toxin-antitoxin system VapC family toxin [Algoriphagus boritolerans]|uniref:PIN domain nuclease, a component of toxin-antitoxin system (PIN domain) n=1 Tax=Algoriphagus boritolerans DSM 17298 = JCM 18970 TaxID=1120964 RepID=A0A1H5ZMJ8_9BACT|nr:type II toxin-antitoxin system VapC family toxin [Algoriphagus boritolerans]SEG37350.1 PIN domain nuclease, a component of toxin-antitoxin system (PIN domain) [Algoriphagus boritolerans DSM 17298 = JCM 18970]
MAYLLDTHTLLWFVSGDNQLPESSRMIIKDIHESCFLSAASLWEITIKLQIKKLELGISLEELFEFVDRNQIEVIPINYLHLLQLSRLPAHHNDPFDRLIIAQAISENLKLISRDKIFKNYSVNLVWD